MAPYVTACMLMSLGLHAALLPVCQNDLRGGSTLDALAFNVDCKIHVLQSASWRVSRLATIHTTSMSKTC